MFCANEYAGIVDAIPMISISIYSSFSNQQEFPISGGNYVRTTTARVSYTISIVSYYIVDV